MENFKAVSLTSDKKTTNNQKQPEGRVGNLEHHFLS